MKSKNEKQALPRVVELLEHYLKGQAVEVEFEPRPDSNLALRRLDLTATVGGYHFVVEYKSSNLLATVVKGIEQLLNYPTQRDDEIRVLAVPFMGEAGSRKCEEAGISWLDLSGNADIFGPGLRICVRGEKNKYVSTGRRENPFAPKSSRIARHLLYQLDHAYTQRELADETGLGEGFVSRIVKTLEAQQLVARDPQGRLLVSKPGLLLDAWIQGYDFPKHEIVQGHVAGRSGEEIQAKLSSYFQSQAIEHAATGLGAAWLYSRFAAFRTVSFYLKEWPEKSALEQIGFREGSAGANVWLVIPKDPDVFHGVKAVTDIPCVHPIQVYLDLQAHPERSEEAAAELRKQLELQ